VYRTYRVDKNTYNLIMHHIIWKITTIIFYNIISSASNNGKHPQAEVQARLQPEADGSGAASVALLSLCLTDRIEL
jgi:hypothetical protein